MRGALRQGKLAEPLLTRSTRLRGKETIIVIAHYLLVRLTRAIIPEDRKIVKRGKEKSVFQD
jgi:hypothetical protein